MMIRFFARTFANATKSQRSSITGSVGQVKRVGDVVQTGGSYQKREPSTDLYWSKCQSYADLLHFYQKKYGSNAGISFKDVFIRRDCIDFLATINKITSNRVEVADLQQVNSFLKDILQRLHEDIGYLLNNPSIPVSVDQDIEHAVSEILKLALNTLSNAALRESVIKILTNTEFLRIMLRYPTHSTNYCSNVIGTQWKSEDFQKEIYKAISGGAPIHQEILDAIVLKVPNAEIVNEIMAKLEGAIRKSRNVHVAIFCLRRKVALKDERALNAEIEHVLQVASGSRDNLLLLSYQVPGLVVSDLYKYANHVSKLLQGLIRLLMKSIVGKVGSDQTMLRQAIDVMHLYVSTSAASTEDEVLAFLMEHLKTLKAQADNKLILLRKCRGFELVLLLDLTNRLSFDLNVSSFISAEELRYLLQGPDDNTVKRVLTRTCKSTKEFLGKKLLAFDPQKLILRRERKELVLQFLTQQGSIPANSKWLNEMELLSRSNNVKSRAAVRTNGEEDWGDIHDRLLAKIDLVGSSAVDAKDSVKLLNDVIDSCYHLCLNEVKAKKYVPKRLVKVIFEVLQGVLNVAKTDLSPSSIQKLCYLINTTDTKNQQVIERFVKVLTPNLERLQPQQFTSIFFMMVSKRIIASETLQELQLKAIREMSTYNLEAVESLAYSLNHFQPSPHFFYELFKYAESQVENARASSLICDMMWFGIQKNLKNFLQMKTLFARWLLVQQSTGGKHLDIYKYSRFIPALMDSTMQDPEPLKNLFLQVLNRTLTISPRQIASIYTAGLYLMEEDQAEFKELERKLLSVVKDIPRIELCKLMRIIVLQGRDRTRAKVFEALLDRVSDPYFYGVASMTESADDLIHSVDLGLLALNFWSIGLLTEENEPAKIFVAKLLPLLLKVTKKKCETSIQNKEHEQKESEAMNIPIQRMESLSRGFNYLHMSQLMTGFQGITSKEWFGISAGEAEQIKVCTDLLTELLKTHREAPARTQTRFERKVSHYLSKVIFPGQDIMREYEIDQYRVDVYVPDHKLIIECCGITHYFRYADESRLAENDQNRVTYLKSLGYKIVLLNVMEWNKMTPDDQIAHLRNAITEQGVVLLDKVSL